MRPCVSTLSCPDWPLDRIVAACAAAGIEGIEFRGLEREIDVTRHVAFTAELDQTLAALRAAGLEVPCLATSVTLVSPSPQRWQDMLDEAHRYALLAERTWAPYVRIFGGGVPSGTTDEEALSMARRHLRQVIKICRGHNALPLVETHDVYATGPAMRDLLHDLPPDEVGVVWDVEQTVRAGEAPAATAEALRPFIRHVHLKDSVPGTGPAPAGLQTGPSVPRLLGEGDLPLAEVMAALRGAGYGGWLCLETEKRWHAEAAPDPEQSLPQFAAYLAAAKAVA